MLGAITLGARVIKKRFTDDNTREGPDHPFSMNPVTWLEMVDRSRELEAALVNGVKRAPRRTRRTRSWCSAARCGCGRTWMPGSVLSAEDLGGAAACAGALEPYG